MERKHQLVFISPGGDLQRLWKPDALTTLKCAYKRENCSLYCVALGLVEREALPDLGLVCYAMSSVTTIGFLDPDTADHEIVQSLKVGSNLQNDMELEK